MVSKSLRNELLNILLINHYAGSIKHGMEYRPYYFAREWVRAGHSVTILAATESHVRTIAPDASGDFTEEWLDGIRYVWLKTPPYAGNGAARARNMFSFVTRAVRNWGRVSGSWKPDLVIASSTYPLDIFAARRIAKASKAKLVYEVHDLWPLSPIELGGMSRKHPFIVVMQHAEDTAYRVSDKVISLLPKTQNYMMSRGMRQDKWRWIPNGIDPAEWEQGTQELPKEHSDAIQAAKERGALLIGYAGAHGIANGIEPIVDAAIKLQSYTIEVFMVGKGPEKERLKARAKDTKIHFLSPIPKTTIPLMLAEMDGLYQGYRDEPLFRFGVCSNKLMDYMMAAKPVIYAINGHDDTVDKARCGWTIPAEDSDALAETILKLHTLPVEERNAMGKRGRDYVLANHDYSVLAKQFLEAVT